MFLFQVLFAFMVGLHNLYWYYGEQEFVVPEGGFYNSSGGKFGGSQGGIRGKGGGISGTTHISGLNPGDIFHAVESFQGSVHTS